MTTTNPNALAQTPDHMDVLVTHLESLVRPDDDKPAELNDHLSYLKSEVAGGHYTPEEAITGIKAVAGDYIADTFIMPIYNERVTQATLRDGKEPDTDAR